MNKTRYISKIDIGRILTEMLHEKNINNNESADNIFSLMKEIPVDDGRYLCNFSESNQKILNKYMYVLDAPLEKEFEIVKPRIEKYFEELNQRLGMKIFTYEIDEYCDNRICFKLNE